MDTSESIPEISKVRIRRLQSYPSQSDGDETDFETACEAFPVRVPLDRVQIGSVCYVSREWNDIEVVYELESSDILLRCAIEGENGEPKGTFRVGGVSGADLSLVCVVPGSLESMVSQLILELDSEYDIVFEPHTVHPLLKEPSSSSANLDKDSRDQPKTEDGVPEKSLKTRILKMTASVHETGHFRDVLLFLKCEDVANLNPEIAYLPEKFTAYGKNKEESNSKPFQLTFLDFLPLWVLYIPWRFYSRMMRTVIQRFILLYYILTIIWASWQLYRHVHVIHIVLEPIIMALKYYLASVMETFDWCLALFTRFWLAYLSPLNILVSVLLMPLFQVLLQVKTVLMPVFKVLSQCLTNSTLLSTLKSLWTVLYQVSSIGWQLILYCIALLGKPLLAFWNIFKVLGKPFSGVWQTMSNTQVAVGSLEFQKVRLNWVVNMVVGSFRSIGKGLAWFVGYTRKKQKRRQAILNTSKLSPSSTSSHTPQHSLRNRRMPIYYSSTLSKQT